MYTQNIEFNIILSIAFAANMIIYVRINIICIYLVIISDILGITVAQFCRH